MTKHNAHPRQLPPGNAVAENYDYFGLIDEAGDNLRAFWRVGQRSLQEHPAFSPNTKAKTDAVRKLGPGWSLEKLRVARAFASRVNEEELERLIKEAAEARVEVSQVIACKIFEVENEKARDRLWRDYLAQNWTKSQVLAAIRQRGLRTGRPKHAVGRKLAIPATEAEAMDRLRIAASAFVKQLGAVKAAGHIRDSLRRQLAAAVSAAEALQRAIGK